MIGSIVLLTPLGALVAVAAALPLAALALAARRVRRARSVLRLEPPPPESIVPKAVALALFVVLLATAAAQPAIRTRTTARVRTDAQAMFVLDVSRSMRAAASPTAQTRLARAKRDALMLRAAIPEIPSGVATMTDRVLPDLLPNPDPTVFDGTVEHAIAIDMPPPQDENVVATSLATLAALGTQNYFAAAAHRRLVVVLTDGETRTFDPARVARALGGAHVVLVHVWKKGEAVYDAGRPEAGYHEDAASGAALASLAAAARGAAFGEGQLATAARAERAALGSGPAISEGMTMRTRTLAPYIALCALLPLLLVVFRPHRLRRGVRPAVHRKELVSP
ncbi:MAG TPA: vWA domain-containing protein [Gaiellaceae bacterium]